MASKAKTVADLVGENGKIFVKSNHGLCCRRWRAVSFTKPSDAKCFQEKYNSECDVLIYLGTGQEPTKKWHRKFVLSIVIVDKSKILPTKLILDQYDPKIWKDIEKRFPNRWKHSFVPKKSYSATDVKRKRRKYNDFLTSETTRQLGFGRAIQVTPRERASFLSLEIGCDLLS